MRTATTAAAAVVLALATPAPTYASETLDGLHSRTWAMTVADWDGDGDDDVFVSRHGGETHRDRWWLQQDDGTFVPDGWELPGNDRHGCAAGDFNADGLLDLLCQTGATRGEGRRPSELFIRQPDGTAVDQAAAWGADDPYGRGRRPLVADFDADGIDDVYMTSWAIERDDGQRNDNMLLLSTGFGFVESTTSLTGKRGAECVDVGDWNGDGLPDVVTCGDDLELHVNHGGGRFQDVTHLLGDATVPWPRDATLTDVDGDGWDDLVVVARDTVQVRLNRAPYGVKFSDVDRQWPHTNAVDVEVADVDGDGRVDDGYLVQGVWDGRNWPDLHLPGFAGRSAGSMVAVGAGGSAVWTDGGLVVSHGDAAAAGPVQVRSTGP